MAKTEEQKAADKAAKEQAKAADKAATASSDAMPAPERNERWEAHLAAYEKQNPAKFAAKKAKGEFDKVPDSFK